MGAHLLLLEAGQVPDVVESHLSPLPVLHEEDGCRQTPGHSHTLAGDGTMLFTVWSWEPCSRASRGDNTEHAQQPSSTHSRGFPDLKGSEFWTSDLISK